MERGIRRVGDLGAVDRRGAVRGIGHAGDRQVPSSFASTASVVNAASTPTAKLSSTASGEAPATAAGDSRTTTSAATEATGARWRCP